MQPYIEAFLPLFVAINLPGILPLFIGLTGDLDEAGRRKLATQAITAAFLVAIVILFAGQVIFKTMGITLNDLRVGGGLILLVLSITDLIFGDFKRRAPSVNGKPQSVGIVPLGIPLIIGPAAITTILVSQQQFGYLPVMVSMAVNLGGVLLIFWYGPRLLERLGTQTVQAVAKVASLFLAAIAVAMIRAGVTNMILSS